MKLWCRLYRALIGGNEFVDCPLCSHHRDFMFTLTLCELCKSRGVLKRWKLGRYMKNLGRRIENE